MAFTTVSSGQTLNGTAVNTADIVNVLSGGRVVATTVKGSLIVNSGGVATSTTVTSGIEQVNGGTDTGSTVTGGQFDVFQGGTAIATTILNGAVALDVAGSFINPVIGTGTTLAISPGQRVVNPALALGASLDLQGLVFAVGGSATLDANDLLTITEGGTTTSLQLVGDYTGEGFTLNPDRGGLAYGVFGTAITVASGAIQVPTGIGTFAPVFATTPIQAVFVQQIAGLAANTAATQTVLSAPGQQRTTLVTSPVVVDLPNGFDTIVGNAAVPFTRVLLDNPTATYITGGTGISIVVAADAAPDTIINNNPGGVLLAVTGAATFNGTGDTLEGLAGANQFITGINGRDAVLLDGVANNLTTNGTDTVLVGGPSTITAAAGGLDNVIMTAGTTLAFINTSNPQTVDSVRGAANGIVLLAGPGNTAITGVPGAEFFFVDTSAGNTTLNAGPSGANALTFIKDADNATARVQVNNLAPSDVVAIHGYAGFTIQATPNGSILALSDGSQVTFTNLSTTLLQQTVRIT